MADYCTLLPDAPNGNPSKLLTDLRALLKDNDLAKRVWAFTQTQLFQSTFTNLATDSNGEVTVDSLLSVLNLQSYLNKSSKDIESARTLNIMDSSGRSTEFEKAEVALSKADQFNETAESKVAVVERTENGTYIASIVDNTAMNTANADRNASRRALNKSLIQLIQRLGFNVEFTDDPSYDGVFDPLFAEDNVEMLRTIIKVQNSEAGLDALPEEAMHFVLAGLRDNPLKKRLDAIMTPELVKAVLGNQYDAYQKLYNSEERLREEAEGKLLARLLRGEQLLQETTAEPETESGIRGLLTRLWNWAMNLFSKTSEVELNNALVNATNALQPIVDAIESGAVEFIIDEKSIMDQQKLYEINKRTSALQEFAEQGIVKIRQQISIIEATTKDVDTSELRKMINTASDHYDQCHFQLSCLEVLATISEDLKRLKDETVRLGYVFDNSNDLSVIEAEADLVYRLGIALEGYQQYFAVLQDLPRQVQSGEIDVDKDIVTQITDLAQKLSDATSSMQRDYRSLRFAVLKQYMMMFHGDHGNKPSWFKESESLKWQTVDMILNGAKEDISFWDSTIFSGGDSRNPLINVIHKIVLRRQTERNSIINKYIQKITEAQSKLHNAGYENNFIYQLDENGIPTGYIVSPLDYNRYDKEFQTYVESLNDPNITAEMRNEMLDKWIKEHTDKIYSGLTDDLGNPIMLQKPKAELYAVPDYNKGWSKEQQEYYDTYVKMMEEMNALLPQNKVNMMLAPQVRKSISQIFDHGFKAGIKAFWGLQKQKFDVVEDNTDYGMDDKTIQVDFAGRKIQRVPVYHVNKMEDMTNLSTDATHAMCCYISMAVNYSEMSKIASTMRLLKEHVKENYEVVQTDGGKPIRANFRTNGYEYSADYTKTGVNTNAGREIMTYIDRTLFNETKNKLGSIKLPGINKTIGLDALTNLLLHFTSVGRIGLNALSGITNIAQGETQMAAEAAAGRNFNLAAYAFAKKEYGSLLKDFVLNYNSVDRHDKLTLLINTFNAMEEFFSDARTKDFNKNAFKRLLGKGNVYFLNTAGEHELHCTGMLAMLKFEKVILAKSGEEVSLYDALDVIHDNNGWRLQLKEDIKFPDKMRPYLRDGGLKDIDILKKEDSDTLFVNMAMHINTVNDGMFGGYSEIERGNANQKAIWRLCLQFRQWMPAQYNKMYAREYYDAVTGERKRGAYVSLFSFIAHTLVDLKRMSIQASFEKNKLSAEEWANAKVAIAQTCMFIFCAVFRFAFKGWKDDDKLLSRLTYYTVGGRLYMEVGAQVPFPPTFIKNILTLIQSPAPSADSLKVLNDLFSFSTIQSGRFKGWPRAARALYASTPFYNLQKVLDMRDYQYMFNVFN